MYTIFCHQNRDLQDQDEFERSYEFVHCKGLRVSLRILGI